jgi:hypothetical protein
MVAMLAVGPRNLPDDGWVRVWVDSGSAAGREIPVPVESLRLADLDDGRSGSAIYTIDIRTCRG